jgi:hypothetical protein
MPQLNVCATCCRELRCQKTGVVVRVPSTGYCLRGDAFTCPACGMCVIVANSEGYFEEVSLAREVYYDLQEE